MQGNHAAMMEGPRMRISLFNVTHWMTQVGWLGQTGQFYPWPMTPSKQQEPGGYSPVYIEDGE